MGIHDPLHRSRGQLVRSELGSGYTVSTVRLAARRFETAVFSPGWPKSGDSVETRRAESAAEALTQHGEAVRRWAEPPTPAGWFLTAC
ncbi:MAG: hypothetical protein JKY65_11025 [Planctomycetes bacterium]|nr:hypothetical protein [Planctomycetota bacterium]